MDESFSKSEHIRKKKDFEKIFKFGTQSKDKYITIIRMPTINSQPKTDEPVAQRIGIVISHRIKGSVVRNKLKRRLREIYRKNKSNFKEVRPQEVGPQGDYIILAHPGAESISYSELETEILKLTEKKLK